MKSLTIIKNVLKIAITLIVVTIAFLLTRSLWDHYMNSPWTRDGRVRADVISVAADVAGRVMEVPIRDNAYVHKGDVLMKIDPAHYTLALVQAEAMVAQSRVALTTKQRDAARRALLDGDVISNESRENSSSDASSAEAVYRAALAARDMAKLNLDRTSVLAPADGWVANLNVHAGDFAQIGVPKMTVVDANSFWIYGYFEENKIPLMQVGDKAEIRLLGSDMLLAGHIDSIARGITDRDNAPSSNGLANVNPSFNWVRLAQRVPVRIHIDTVPNGITLAAGMTCTVVIKPGEKVAGQKSVEVKKT
ncbi:HlyD family efflux transporter periplasmic adaptor subunit [Glaciimonas immobilis]|uniref:Multidrug resistance efflux pump n=1 Tax=Glaciimonas immobilis TaxID=728004 RepID=A0A840RU71_9BURK|nr:biotin/lipoyl-binding protein [Glaciimonas immobilis]KAF3997599.1 biotin/lipoyl-binding protein [Glaciimonas immobilis]MBB5200702.1 multidrug resistance efflux pump [Glaciimonas immobilis]